MFLYADDLVLIGENELGLQLMLGTLGIWCRNNKISVNGEKSKNIHFRTPSIQRSSYNFKFGDLLALEITHQHNYILRSYTYYVIIASHVASLHIHKSK